MIWEVRAGRGEERVRIWAVEVRRWRSVLERLKERRGVGEWWRRVREEVAGVDGARRRRRKARQVGDGFGLLYLCVGIFLLVVRFFWLCSVVLFFPFQFFFCLRCFLNLKFCVE